MKITTISALIYESKLASRKESVTYTWYRG
jgi:hypothetical protein